MKHVISLLSFFVLVATGALAQEPVPRADAVKYAAVVNFDLDKLADTPIPTDGDIKRPFAMKADKHGAMVVPEVKLSAATLANAGRDVLPIGQLWFASLVPMKNGQAVANDQLKMVTAQYEGREFTVPICVLGVRKTAGDGLELLIYGKGKEPLLSLPLTKSAREQKWPLEFDAEREGDSSGRLTLSIVGKYQASFQVTGPAE